MNVITASVCASALFFASAAFAQEATCGADFFDALYPRGMPTGEEYFSGKPVRAEYHCLDKAFSHGLNIVVYTEQYSRPEGGESFHRIFLALFSADGQRPAYRLDVTKLTPVYLEVPGVVDTVAATVNTIETASQSEFMIHLGLRTGLTGSGGVLSASDAFYVANGPRLSLEQILVLKKTSEHSRNGDLVTDHDSNIWVAHKNDEQIPRIVIKALDSGKVISTQVYAYDKHSRRYATTTDSAGRIGRQLRRPWFADENQGDRDRE